MALERLLFMVFTLIGEQLTAQTPESIFPHAVGDRWDYWHSAYGLITTAVTKDSTTADGSTFLFYDGGAVPDFMIDTNQQVYYSPTYPNSRLFYKLNADSGEVWEGGPYRWVWLASVDTQVWFSHLTVVKEFRFGIQHPDTSGWDMYYEIHHLASGYGLVYWHGEPSWAQFLQGCIIAGDTFGILTTGLDVDGMELPAEYSLTQNYPNPFNPVTKISYTLPKASYVRLKVYNVLGEEVSSLVDGYMQPGSRSAEFDGSKLASGMYFYRLTAGESVEVKKMMLVK